MSSSAKKGFRVIDSSKRFKPTERALKNCLAGEEPPTEQGLRILGANLR